MAAIRAGSPFAAGIQRARPVPASRRTGSPNTIRVRPGWIGAASGNSAIRSAIQPAHARVDLVAEPGPVEDAVVADVRLHIVLLEFRRQARAEVVRGLGLADAGDIVLLALDGEQADVGDQLGPDQPSAMLELALGQQ